MGRDGVDIDYVQFLNLFYRYVPEMRAMVEQRLRDGNISMDDGGLMIWGVGVMDCVVALMNRAEVHSKTLDSVFLFMEHMAMQKEEVKSLLKYTFHVFMNEDHLREPALARMGHETRKYWDAYMEFLRLVRLKQLSSLYSDEELKMRKQKPEADR